MAQWRCPGSMSGSLAKTANFGASPDSLETCLRRRSDVEKRRVRPVGPIGRALQSSRGSIAEGDPLTMQPTIKPEYWAKFGGSELVVTPANPLLPRTVITIDELPWVGYIGPDGVEAPGVYTKTLADPASDNFFMLVRAEPGAIGPPHWHLSDT